MAAPSLFERTGIPRLAKDLLRRRDRFRQFVGIALMIFLSIMGRPVENFFQVGAVLVLIGVVFRLWASGHIVKNKELADSGPYALVRHPLYTGNFLITVGICPASGLWWSVPVMLAFWLFFYPSTIKHEDGKLHAKFGEVWEKWSAQTPALIPNFRLHGRKIGGRWSFSQCTWVNGEPLIALVVLVCLAYLAYKLA
ncbi:MAG: isoprenylcysteine carboxylmethyltransferase family protein [Thermoanaerobaculales bacterium]|nr:isoprenylcysteine carboxylmethyltransferase family protein [Thermoanaerobaculales bacterium]